MCQDIGQSALRTPFPLSHRPAGPRRTVPERPIRLQTRALLCPSRHNLQEQSHPHAEPLRCARGEDNSGNGHTTSRMFRPESAWFDRSSALGCCRERRKASGLGGGDSLRASGPGQDTRAPIRRGQLTLRPVRRTPNPLPTLRNVHPTQPPVSGAQSPGTVFACPVQSPRPAGSA